MASLHIQRRTKKDEKEIKSEEDSWEKEKV